MTAPGDTTRRGTPESELAWQSRLYELGQQRDWEAVLHMLDHPPDGLTNAPAWQWSARGHALEQLTRPEEALAAYQQALAMDNASLEYLVDLARILSTLHRSTEALNTAKQVVEMGTPESTGRQPAAEKQQLMVAAWEICGDIYATLGRQQEALDAFEHALALNPTGISALQGKGAALQALKRPDEALVVIEHALTLHPKEQSLLESKAATLLDLKQPEQALLALDVANSLGTPSASLQINRGVALYRLRRYREAMETFNQVHPTDPAMHSRILTWKGYVFQQQHREQEALQAYRQAIILDKENAHAWEGRCVVAFRHGHLIEGWKAYRQVLRLQLAKGERD